MKYLITFPEYLREEIEENLKNATKEVEELNKSKRATILKNIFKKFGINQTAIFSSYKFIGKNKVIWEYTILGETAFPENVLLNIVEKKLKKDFNCKDIKVEIYKNKNGKRRTIK